MEAWLERACTPAYWLELNPELTMDAPPAPPVLRIDEPARQQLFGDLLTDGYFQYPPALPAEHVRRMAEGALRLQAENIPPVFMYVYDDFYQLSRYASELLEAILGPGFKVLPSLVAWCIDARGGSVKGWHPHRDRDYETLGAHGLPKSMSLWIPLTDATPLNGCIYVVPTHRDPHFLGRVMQNNVPRPQEIRALPAAAGSILGWNHALLHWGGRASDKATTPRISFSIEYQRGDVPPYDRPLLDPFQPPSFPHRLALIAHQLLQYGHMQNVGAGMRAAAAWIKERYPLPE